MTTKRNLAPTAKELSQPAYDALLALGGSGSVGEILDRIIADGDYSDAEISEPHKNETKMKYNLRWALHDLSENGVVVKSKSHIWSLTKKYAKRIPLPFKTPQRPQTAVKSVKQSKSSQKIVKSTPSSKRIITDDWKQYLLEEILRKMDPQGFEHFSMAIMRKCGYKDLRVTRYTADGGIDGLGKASVGSLSKTDVAFQCKRYKGTVSVDEVRGFVGSLVSNNISTGIFITTGQFREANIEEIKRTKAVQVTFIDGEKLIELLVKNKMGLKPVTTYEIDLDFFNAFNKKVSHK